MQWGYVEVSENFATNLNIFEYMQRKRKEFCISFYIKYAMRLLWSFWKYLEVFRLNLNYILIINSYLKIVYTLKTK